MSAPYEDAVPVLAIEELIDCLRAAHFLASAAFIERMQRRIEWLEWRDRECAEQGSRDLRFLLDVLGIVDLAELALLVERGREPVVHPGERL